MLRYAMRCMWTEDCTDPGLLAHVDCLTIMDDGNDGRLLLGEVGEIMGSAAASLERIVLCGTE